MSVDRKPRLRMWSFPSPSKASKPWVIALLTVSMFYVLNKMKYGSFGAKVYDKVPFSGQECKFVQAYSIGTGLMETLQVMHSPTTNHVDQLF